MFVDSSQETLRDGNFLRARVTCTDGETRKEDSVEPMKAITVPQLNCKPLSLLHACQALTGTVDRQSFHIK